MALKVLGATWIGAVKTRGEIGEWRVAREGSVVNACGGGIDSGRRNWRIGRGCSDGVCNGRERVVGGEGRV